MMDYKFIAQYWLAFGFFILIIGYAGLVMLKQLDWTGQIVLLILMIFTIESYFKKETWQNYNKNKRRDEAK